MPKSRAFDLTVQCGRNCSCCTTCSASRRHAWRTLAPPGPGPAQPPRLLRNSTCALCRSTGLDGVQVITFHCDAGHCTVGVGGRRRRSRSRGSKRTMLRAGSCTGHSKPPRWPLALIRHAHRAAAPLLEHKGQQGAVVALRQLDGCRTGSGPRPQVPEHGAPRRLGSLQRKGVSTGTRGWAGGTHLACHHPAHQALQQFLPFLWQPAHAPRPAPRPPPPPPPPPPPAQPTHPHPHCSTTTHTHTNTQACTHPVLAPA